MYSNDFIVLAGDLNSLDVVNLAVYHGFVQMINQPTQLRTVLIFLKIF
jgi:hypothetical protein